MNGVLRHLLAVVIHLGLLGPLILGVLDSSFLFFPFGNDLLLVLLISRDHNKAYTYVPAAALGSTLGVFLLDLVARKGGEQGLKKLIKPKRLEALKKKIKENAATAIVVACVAPPPFPFTPVVAAASALQYPRARLLATVFGSRLVRFSIVAAAAVWLGRRILAIAKSSAFECFMAAFILFCLVGSVISVVRWTRSR